MTAFTFMRTKIRAFSCKSSWGLALSLSLFSGTLHADKLTLISPDARVNVLELYTSQGCSSCPPAEHWLSRYVEDPGLWKQFIPLNFHVDYWDYIGWKDPFANSLFSYRQRLYEQLKLAKNVATPGFIVNGQGWNGWFYGQQPRFTEQQASGVITATIEDSQIQVLFSPRVDKLNIDDMPEVDMNRLRAHVAILGFGASTTITAGENKGRVLSHDFVVLAYHNQLMTKEDELAKANLSLPDASAFRIDKKALAVWVSDRINPSPIQAVGNWLK